MSLVQLKLLIRTGSSVQGALAQCSVYSFRSGQRDIGLIKKLSQGSCAPPPRAKVSSETMQCSFRNSSATDVITQLRGKERDDGWLSLCEDIVCAHTMCRFVPIYLLRSRATRCLPGWPPFPARRARGSRARWWSRRRWRCPCPSAKSEAVSVFELSVSKSSSMAIGQIDPRMFPEWDPWCENLPRNLLNDYAILMKWQNWQRNCTAACCILH